LPIFHSMSKTSRPSDRATRSAASRIGTRSILFYRRPLSLLRDTGVGRRSGETKKWARAHSNMRPFSKQLIIILSPPKRNTETGARSNAPKTKYRRIYSDNRSKNKRLRAIREHSTPCRESVWLDEELDAENWYSGLANNPVSIRS